MFCDAAISSVDGAEIFEVHIKCKFRVSLGIVDKSKSSVRQTFWAWVDELLYELFCERPRAEVEFE